ncbi:MAG: hypothetical protein DRH26_06690 [Deltaproteobacteria bacterium]|nr:MAG: hypothetical protein DRH26_06690 [Deltaproteobacteria bacterium]
MDTYNINEGSFQITGGWEDETTNVLTWLPKNESSRPFSFTIERDESEADENLESYAARQLKTLIEDLDGFEMIRRRRLKIGSYPAEELEFTWISDGEKVAQRQAYVIRQNKVLAFTGTMMEKFTSDGVMLWETILSNFRFREKGAVGFKEH